jgi:hypothetical protein
MTVQESFASVQDRPWLKVYRELGVTPAAPGIAERSLADYVEEHAEIRAAQVALVYTDNGIEITWAQLDAYANRFANLLRSLGMQRGDVLGIHLPNTPQYVAQHADEPRPLASAQTPTASAANVRVEQGCLSASGGASLWTWPLVRNGGTSAAPR